VPVHFHEGSGMRRYAGLALAAVLTLACGQDDGAMALKSGAEGAVAEQSAAANSPPMTTAPAARDMAAVGNAFGSVGSPQRTIGGDTGTTGAPVMIIRTGHASVEVGNVDQAAVKVRALAASLGGYIANSSFQGGEHNVRSATLELKIPAQRYDDAVGGLPSIGEVESVNSTSEDVGEEYVDLSTRVANARRLEQRLVQLLATRTGRLEDVLAVERELARVREEIERAEGRLRYLRTRAAMSTLTVLVHEDEPILGRAGDNPIVAAFKAAWRNFVRFVAGLIAAMGIIIPVAVIAAVGFLGWRKYWKKR
jgi:FlaG/FlaF family flagellin (archaellin)